MRKQEAQRGKGSKLRSRSQEVLIPYSKSHTLSAPCQDGSFLGAGYWAGSSVLFSGICRGGARPLPPEPRPVPTTKWFTDDQEGLPGKGGGSLTSPWDHMPPPPVAQWVWSCLAPSAGRGGRRLETWSLGPRLGWEKEELWAHLEIGSVSGSGQERKYNIIVWLSN